MTSSSLRIITILVGVLVAVIVVGGLILILVPSSNAPADNTTPVASDTPQLDTAVLRRSEYLRLNQQAIREGAIPVQPPAVIGKANPFL